MPGQSVIQGAQPVEYAEESTFATDLGNDTVWNWFGIGTSWDVDQGVESESITYLPEYGASNKLEKSVNVKLREMYSGDISFHPQNFSLLQYWTGADGGVSDTLTSVQIGEVNESLSTDEFRRLKGGVGNEVTLSIEEDGVAEISGDFIFADANDWTTTDYVDTSSGGAHASEDSTTPFSFDDLSNVQWGGSDLDGMVESVELTVSNELAEVRDSNSSNSTQLETIEPIDREITVDVTLTYDSFNMLTDVRSYTSQDFAFDIGSTTFTVSDVQFPELPYEYSADDLVSDSLSSDRASDLSWS